MRKRITRESQVRVDINAIGDRIMLLLDFKRETFNERLRPLLSQGIPYDKAVPIIKEEFRKASLPINKLFKNE